MAFVFIKRCFDSHVHWPEVGEVQSYIDLTNVTSLEALEQRFASVNLPPSSDQWIRGFGWDEFKFQNQNFLNKEYLDSFFPNHPVSLIRADGHSIWVNSKALAVAGLKNYDNKSVFSENEKAAIDQCIPEPSDEQLKDFLLKGQEAFIQQGFTHIRDMGFNFRKWNIAKQLCLSQELRLFVEVNFLVSSLNDLPNILAIALQAKEESQHLKLLKVSGIKFYFDGSLGSETALISEPYLGSRQKGLQLFSDREIQEMIYQTWKVDLPVAVHALGDEAVDKLVNISLKVQESNGVNGILNIEHAELIKPETLVKMSKLKVHIHMQPSHFLSDEKWINQKIFTIKQNLFRWHDLEKRKITFSFGSDAPIESPSYYNTKRALEAAKNWGISNIEKPIETYFEHPDASWGSNCFTKYFDDGTIQRHFQF